MKVIDSEGSIGKRVSYLQKMNLAIFCRKKAMELESGSKAEEQELQRD